MCVPCCTVVNYHVKIGNSGHLHIDISVSPCQGKLLHWRGSMVAGGQGLEGVKDCRGSRVGGGKGLQGVKGWRG